MSRLYTTLQGEKSDQRYEIGPRRSWRNKVTGQYVSIYGAVPFSGEDEKNWEIVVTGYGFYDRYACVYHSRHGQTRDEVVALLTRLNPNFVDERCDE